MRRFTRLARLAPILTLALACAALLPVAGPRAIAQSAGKARALPLTGDVEGTHDPSIIKDGDTWYVFATGKTPEGGQFALRCSKDLLAWKRCGQVFDAVPDWIHKDSPGTVDLWAPDISFYKGEYRLYYAYSLFGKNTSGIALATNKTLDRSRPDYKWVDQGLVLRSTENDDFNAIDPNFIVDTHGGTWLAMGSFWSGIKLHRLDNSTGKASTDDKHYYAIATREKPANAAPAPAGLPPDWEAVEAPFIVHHGGYYYLFVSWDLCCRGTKSTYRTMVGRAREVTGPYLDQSGKAMSAGGGSPLLIPNGRWLGPGGVSVLMQPKGDDLLVFHAYDAKTGKPSLQISTIDWTDSWPHAALGD